jgi:TonB-linked SusC/RagA family outer membrane protein
MKRFTVLLSFFVFVGFQALQAQNVQITGNVTSADDGSPLPGVSVVVKGTTIGTVTNFNGDYELGVPQSASTLSFSFVGMTSQDVPIEGRTIIDLVMVTDALDLGEVVVTALGVSREKKSLGYSVQDVSGEDLSKAREQNIINSLSGRVAGAQITNSSGAVGASTRIVLRGATSLGGNNQPLFVVDGIPIDNSNMGGTGNESVNRGSGAADINPNDVEKMTVLKGPNAAALYGSRASNGVILIETKSGKGSKGIGVSVNNTTSFETPLRLPDFQNGFGQGSSGKFEFVDGAGGGINDGTDESWGPKLDAGLTIPQWDSPVSAAGVRSKTPWVSQPDNVKSIFNTGHTTATNVAVSGGSDKSSFRLSYTDSQQKGMVPNTDLMKKNLNLNGSLNVTNKLAVSGGGTYNNSKSDNMPGYGYSGQNIMQQFIWFGRQVNMDNLRKYRNADGSKNSWNYNYHNNPFFTLNENLNSMQRERFMGNAKVSYQFTDWLSGFVRTGGDIYTNINTEKIAVTDIENPLGSYFESTRTVREINSDFLFTAAKQLSQDLYFSLSAGGSRMDYSYNYSSGAANELAIPGVYNVANSAIPQVSTNTARLKRINSMYFSGQVSLKNALFLDVTGRNDWSSTLPSASNSYFYPSFTLSGIFTDLLNMDSQVLNFGKLRASWAKVGSDTDPYQLLPTLSFGDGWNASTKLLNLFVPNNLPNADLKPQFVTSLEFGVELKFLNNRLGLDATYYDSKATDQIISIPISAASGYLTKNINAGRIDNKGVEVMLYVTPVKSKDFTWDMTFNFAKNQNKVVELADGVEQYVLGTYWSLQVMAIPGQPYGSLFGYDLLRDSDGNILNEGGLPSQGDLKILGNYQPNWTGGMKNDIRFKNISLGVLIDTRQGGQLYSMTTTWGRYAGVLKETLLGREGGIVGVGTMQTGTKVVAGKTVPVYATNNVVVTAEEYNKAVYQNSIAFPSVFDASYIKLREVTLGYTFPKLGSLPVRNLSVSFVGRNLLLLWAKVPHIDPETSFDNTNVQGLEFGQLPSARSLGFNISVNF